MNLKQRCAKCRQDLLKDQTKHVLMMGPRGFRRYALCDKCAKKAGPTPNPSPNIAKGRRVFGEGGKAGGA